MRSAGRGRARGRGPGVGQGRGMRDDYAEDYSNSQYNRDADENGDKDPMVVDQNRKRLLMGVWRVRGIKPCLHRLLLIL
jgi:hypothetical protein